MSIMLNGREIVAEEKWMCACSGGCGGEWTARCAIKGGEYYTVLVDAVTGETVAEEIGTGYDVAGLVADYGWEDLGNGFARRPSR